VRLNSLQTLGALKQIKGIPQLKPLVTKRVRLCKNILSDLEVILHSQNLCLFTMRILRNEIFVNNRDEVLNMAMKEVIRYNRLFQKENYYEETTITHKQVKETFKRIGIKPRHLAI